MDAERELTDQEKVERKRFFNEMFAALAIAFAAFLIRVVVAYKTDETRFDFPDSRDYVKIAQGLTTGGGFSLDDGHIASRPPGYPVFLAMILSSPGKGLTQVRVVQAVLWGCIVLLMWKLVYERFGASAGRLSALVVALYPPFIYCSQLILVETLLAFLIVVSIASLSAFWRNGSLLSVIVGGAASGAAALVHAAHLGFILFAALGGILIAFCARRNKAPDTVTPEAPVITRRRLVLGLCLFVACAFAVVAPWTIRNYFAFRALVPVTSKLGEDLYEAVGPQATGGPIRDFIKWPEGAAGLDEHDRDKFLRAEALREIRSNPGRFLGLSVAKFSRFWSPVPNAGRFRSPSTMLLTLLSFGPVLLLFMLALFRLKLTPPDLLLLLPLIYYTLVHMVFIGSIRYRLPVEPFMIAFACAMLAELVRRRGARLSGADGHALRHAAAKPQDGGNKCSRP
jgi:4-amino-4-deoxy-L-arabinose transferase-like glycosyltransferase